MRNLFTTETQRAQRNDMTLTAETQYPQVIKERRGNNLEKSPLIPLLQRGRFFYSPLWQRGVRGDFLKIMILVVMVYVITACDKKTEGITNPTDTVNSSISFSSSGAAGNNTVYMAKNSSLSSGEILAIDVKASSISGSARGAAFVVDFDSAKITYLDKADGDFFGAGSTTDVALQQGTTNKVVVGVATASGTVTGSGTIVTLKFKATGNSVVDFSNAAVKDSSFNTITVTWSGGTVTVH